MPNLTPSLPAAPSRSAHATAGPRSWYADLLLSLLPLTLVAIGVTLIDPRSLLAYGYFLAFTLVSYRVLIGPVRAEVVWLYAGYAAAAVGLYLIQLWALPEYIGFSGGNGVGTDDCRFWAQVTDVGTRELSADCNYLAKHDKLSYSQFIKGIAWWDLRHPLNILFVNVWGAALLPVAVREVTTHFSRSPVAAKWAFGFSAVCPFTLSNSLVLVRDGWTATAFIIAVLMLLRRRYLAMVAAVGLAFFLRGGSGALVAGALAGLALVAIPNSSRDPYGRLVRRGAVVVLGLVGVGVVGMAVLPQLMMKGVGGSLLREDFLLNFIGGSTPDSTLYVILMQPLAIRVPLGFAFFFGSPFLKPEAMFVDGVFVPRAFMAAVAFPLLFLVSVGPFVRGAVTAFVRRHGLALMAYAMYAVVLLLISQSSLQMRHKTLLMPLFYVLAGYGVAHSTPLGRWLGVGVAAAVFSVEVIFLFL